MSCSPGPVYIELFLWNSVSFYVITHHSFEARKGVELLCKRVSWHQKIILWIPGTCLYKMFCPGPLYIEDVPEPRLNKSFHGDLFKWVPGLGAHLWTRAYFYLLRKRGHENRFHSRPLVGPLRQSHFRVGHTLRPYWLIKLIFCRPSLLIKDGLFATMVSPHGL